jgi:hypothetical protein
MALAGSISFNFPPPRVAAYMSHDYARVSSTVLGFVGRLSATLGYDKVDVSLTLLRELEQVRERDLGCVRVRACFVCVCACVRACVRVRACV